MSDNAKIYAKEIFHICKELEKIIPDFSERLNVQNPDWMQIKKGVKGKVPTIRDYILHIDFIDEQAQQLILY